MNLITGYFQPVFSYFLASNGAPIQEYDPPTNSVLIPPELELPVASLNLKMKATKLRKMIGKLETNMKI